MNQEMLYTIEQDAKRLEKTLRELGVFINHNYFRAVKGSHPFIHDPSGLGIFERRFFFKFYYLVFTTDQLIILDTVYFEEPIDDHVTKINYSDLEEFALKRYISNDYIQFNYGNKAYYFYTKYASWVYTILGETTYSMNYTLLKERNFMGLIK
ncbi:hypothetical protein ACFP65_09250 [Marinilactibacillus sp. GCM10026970]|uniref:hypothetical protein n=1 Tax=Marinilactibacillus sp. GCM10026970 TaxID=3252642 RepID=UPI003611952F